MNFTGFCAFGAHNFTLYWKETRWFTYVGKCSSLCLW